jgi:hypothetical protein
MAFLYAPDFPTTADPNPISTWVHRALDQSNTRFKSAGSLQPRPPSPLSLSLAFSSNTHALLFVYFAASPSLVSNLGPLIVYEFRTHFSSHFASLVTSENLESFETELDARSGDYEFIGREDF